MSNFLVTSRALKSIEKVMNSQDKYGFEKYGKELDHSDDYDWLMMLQEELADGLKYLQCEMDRKKYVIDLLQAALRTDEPKNYVEVALELLTAEGTGK